MEQKKLALYTDISGYALALEEAGWDVTDNIGRKKAPRGTLLNAIKFCIRECDKDKRCAGFTLFNGICWPKDVGMMKQQYKFSGETSQGWRWLYRSKLKTGGLECVIHVETFGSYRMQGDQPVEHSVEIVNCMQILLS